MIKQERNESIARSLMRPVEMDTPPRPSICWMREPKLNGVFARWDPETKSFYSKRGIKFKRHLIPDLYETYEKLKVIDPIDGEFWHEGLTLQQITGALAHERDEPKPLPHKLRYVMFDLAVRGVIARERSMWLVAFATVHNLAHIGDLYELTDTNTDGYIYRHKDGLYMPGACGNVIKVKSWKEIDAMVVGVELGTADSLFAGVTGALRCTATLNGKPTTFLVGTGFSYEDRIEFLTNRPRRVKVRYLHLSPDGFPLNPSYLGLDI